MTLKLRNAIIKFIQRQQALAPSIILEDLEAFYSSALYKLLDLALYADLILFKTVLEIFGKTYVNAGYDVDKNDLTPREEDKIQVESKLGLSYFEK